jgi:uncharacterized cupredoxin-like copper-binding protein
MNRRALGTALFAPLLLAGCGASAAQRRVVPRDPAPDAAVVSVRTTDFAFDPPVLRMPVGKLVRLELTNVGQLEHDVMLHDLPVSGVRFPPGQHLHGDFVAAHASKGKLAWVEFIPGATGTFQVSCSVLGHREAGMVGTLVVE